MTKQATTSNPANVALVLFAITFATVSCAQIKQLVRPNAQSDQVNEFNYGIPFGYKNARPDDGPTRMPRFLILLPDQTRIHLGDLESQPVDLQALGESIKSFADGKAEDEKVVYIASRHDIDASVINALLNELRKSEISIVKLLISTAERRQDSYGNEGSYEKSMGDIPAPDRVFEVLIRSEEFGETAYDAKPNPLTLRVRLHSHRRLDLNNEFYENEDELTSKLDEVFDAREANGVFRENSNEVEKTVLFQIDHSGSDSKVAHKYGDLVRVIDALKGAGSSPIVLIDSGDLWKVATISDRSGVPEGIPEPPKKVPTTISGGVLNGKATSLPKPPYPPAARAVRASGAVSVQVTVNENGSVIDAKAVSGHPLLRASAEQAARGARFSPTVLAGRAVKVTGVITYNFTPPE